MEKQTVGGSTSTDWQQQQQRPPSRGSSLLPPPPQSQSIPIITSSGPSGQHAYLPPPPPVPQYQNQQQLQLPRKKSPGAVVPGASGGGGQGRQDPGGGMSSGRGQGTSHHHQGTTSSNEITAGTIVHQHDLESLADVCSRNPLLCLICNNVYEDPRLLSCFHSLCAKCLPGRRGDAKIVCPLCGKPTALKKDGSGPPRDHILYFLLHTTLVPPEPCANCDNKGRPPMYYCNTCGQVLCNGCREETHRAKMFSAHDIVPVSKYKKETPKKCAIHGEQYIMFSNVDKTMLCINCYRETALDSRLHCVDLETAYNQGCRKLDRAVMTLRDLQVAVRDGITMLKSVLEELRRNSDSEKSAVNAVCQTILDALTKTQENLIRDTNSQMEGKDKVLRGQLCQLRSVLPTIKLHLTMCTTIANATNKYDFLDLVFPLIERLQAITTMGFPIRPAQSSQIKSAYKSEIGRTLEPFLVAGAHAQPTGPVGTSGMTKSKTKDFAHPSTSTGGGPAMDSAFVDPTYAQYFPMSRSTVTPVMTHKTYGGGYPTSQPPTAGASGGPGPSSGRKTPISKAKDLSDEQFAAHCRSFNAHVAELNQRLSGLKTQVQELHRDVTLQRGTMSKHIFRAETALREGLYLEDQLERRHAEMERIRKHLESQWNDNFRLIRKDQEKFQAQMNDLLAMKMEVKNLSSLLQQLKDFLKSLGVSSKPLQQPQHPSGGGASGGAGGGSLMSGPSQGKMDPSSGQLGAAQSGQSSSRQQQQQQQQHQAQHRMISDGMTGRAESGSQVTPSLGEMSYNRDQNKAGASVNFGPSLKSDPRRSSQMQTTGTQQSGKQAQSGFLVPQPRTTTPYNTKGQGDIENIQVDTSYSQPQLSSSQVLKGAGRPLQDVSMKKGVLSQLMDKVRSKDDRKKSCTGSGVSSSSSGGTVPLPVIPSASAVAAQRALKMYDAQCQFGLDSSTSAVSALASSSNRPGPSSHSHHHQEQRYESRPPYTRAKSFVKSKSDDERPPTSKLSQRARSTGQLENESLLTSLTPGCKDFQTILELYTSISKTLVERENKQQMLQRQSYPQRYGYSESHFAPSCSKGSGTLPPSSSSSKTTASSCSYYGQSSSLGRTHNINRGYSSRTTAQEESLTASDDEYQSIPFRIARSHSAPPRKPLTTSNTAQVKVHVHQEPRSSNRASSPAPLSKSLEDSYLYSYLSPQSGGLTSSSSGQSGFGATSTIERPASCESLISVNANNSRKSSIDFDRRSVVTIRRAGSKSALITRQHSWETGMQLAGKREHSLSTPHLSPSEDHFENLQRSRIYDDDDSVVGNTLHKADSFEGHEEAVRSIVAAVQETRTLQRRMQPN